MKSESGNPLVLQRHVIFIVFTYGSLPDYFMNLGVFLDQNGCLAEAHGIKTTLNFFNVFILVLKSLQLSDHQLVFMFFQC